MNLGANNSNSNSNTNNNTNNESQRPSIEYNKPKTLISAKDYIKRVEELCAYNTFSIADDAYLKKVDKLGDDLRDMIIYNEDEIEVKGTKYYVSNKGNDKNDGLSPKTAWATLSKVNSYGFKEGDAVLFERGGFWRGSINARSGVTYTAYGKGHKPKISLSIDGLSGEWKKTDKKNIWVFSSPISESVGLILFNDGEKYGEKKRESIDNLKQNFDFLHAVPTSGVTGTNSNGCVYLYYDGNNPAEDFWSIELSIPKSVVTIAKGGIHDVTLYNLELRLGQDYFFCSGTKNIVVKYCAMYWMGGQENKNGLRYGGGGGCWFGCDTMVFEHCYFYQHFDAGVTPQYNMTDAEPCIFKNFRATSCLFDYCEYPFEYFLSQKTNSDAKYVDTYFAYNFVRHTGYGFGDKAIKSACVKSWAHPNPQENFVIEKNIFDRPYVRLLDMGAKNPNGEPDFDCFPKMNNNVYITVKNESAIRLNGKSFEFNEDGYKQLEDLGFEENAVYMFCEKY